MCYYYSCYTSCFWRDLVSVAVDVVDAAVVSVVVSGTVAVVDVVDVAGDAVVVISVAVSG